MAEHVPGVSVRFANETDINFITSSWLKSFRDGYFNATVGNRVYFDQHHRVLEKLLPRASVLIACNEEKPDQIYGWLCFEVLDRHLVLHYVYVKDPFRQMGLAQQMFDFVMKSQDLDLIQNRVLTTHQTRKSKDFIAGERRRGDDYNSRHPERPIEWLYNPYSLFYTMPTNWERD